MTTESIEALLEVLLKAIPHPHLIERIEMEPAAIRFTWRGKRYRVETNLSVVEVGSGVLIGSDVSILLERVLRLASYSDKVLPA